MSNYLHGKEDKKEGKKDKRFTNFPLFYCF